MNRNLRRDMIHGFYLSSLLKPDESDTEIGATDMRFLDRNGDVAFTTHTKESAVLLRQLAESPRPIKSEDLIDKAVKHLDGADRDALRATLEEIGLYLASLKWLRSPTERRGGGPWVEESGFPRLGVQARGRYRLALSQSGTATG